MNADLAIKPTSMADLSAFPHKTYRAAPDKQTLPGSWVSELVEEPDPREAQLISSEIAGLPTHHTVMLDIDAPARLVPSTTPGHYHLYIDIAVTWESYEPLLDALANAGVIQRGYADASIQRQGTCLRLPWVRKFEGDGLGGSE